MTDEQRKREAIAKTARDLARSTGLSYSEAQQRVAAAKRRSERRRDH